MSWVGNLPQNSILIGLSSESKWNTAKNAIQKPLTLSTFGGGALTGSQADKQDDVNDVKQEEPAVGDQPVGQVPQPLQREGAFYKRKSPKSQ